MSDQQQSEADILHPIAYALEMAVYDFGVVNDTLVKAQKVHPFTLTPKALIAAIEQLPVIRAATAERDRTIVELRAEVERTKHSAIVTYGYLDEAYNDLTTARDQIAALQSRVAELEAAINRWYADDGEALANIAVELLRITTTTEK